MRPDGTQRHRILKNRQNGKRPRLSPDGRWVAFDGAPNPFQPHVMAADGTHKRRISAAPAFEPD